MLQDIDLVYDRTGALVTGRPVKAPAFVAGGVTLSTPSEAQPADHGLIAWSSDPNYASTTSSPVNGTLYLATVWLRSDATVNKLWWIHTTAGVTATAGANWAGIYDASGTRVASVGIDTQAVANGVQSATLSTPAALPAGRYWVALLFNAATAPVVARTFGASASANNMNLAGASLRYAVNGTGLAALPSTITPASNTTTGANAFVVAVS